MSLLKISLPQQGEVITVNLKQHALTLTVNRLTIVTYDRAGRWLGAFLDGKNYQRGMDNRAMVKWAHRNGDGFKIRHRRDLTGTEKHALENRVQGVAAHVLEVVSTAQGEPFPGAQPDPALWSDAKVWLLRAAAWNHDRLAAESHRFLQVYKPIPILPPDQYLALVLQITEGCSYNRCTFCDFYRDRAFRVKTLPEVREHITQVKDLFAESLGLRHVIFLADANALVAPHHYLEEVFSLINRSFDLIPGDLPKEHAVAWRAKHPYGFRGIYSFLDIFTGHHKRVQDFRALHELGLQRVYIGLETGDPDLLAFLKKPGTTDQAVELVQMLREAGVHAGVIVMAGVGGERYAREHVQKTVQVINRMGLGKGDLVYLSEFVGHPESDYTKRATGAGIRPLSLRAVRDQMRDLRTGFRFDDRNRPKVARYDIHEFIY